MDRKDDRINLRINGKLKLDVQRYCDKREIDMSDLVTRFFRRVIHNEETRRKAEEK